jgi:hypothetical protein
METVMTLEEAKEHLRHFLVDNGIIGSGEYIEYYNEQAFAILDGEFTADDLEAIAVYMRSTQ